MTLFFCLWAVLSIKAEKLCVINIFKDKVSLSLKTSHDSLNPKDSSVPLTRRHLIATASFSALALLTACTESSTESTNQTDSGASRTVTDIEGNEVALPENPQRIVTLSEPTLDAVLALGLTPVGAVAGRGQSGAPNYLGDKAAGIEIVGTVSELNYEAIGALSPDLILADGTSINNRPDVLEILRNIAPVVFCGYAGGLWETNFTHVAQAVGKTGEAETYLQDYTAYVEATAQELSQKYSSATFSIVRWQGSGPSLILKELPAGQALESLGLQRPESQDRMGRGHSEPVSLENLANIDGDYMFLGTLGGASQSDPSAEGSADVQGAQEALARAEETSGFTDLKAYQDGHIMLVDGSLWTSTGGPLLMRGIIEDVKTHLL